MHSGAEYHCYTSDVTCSFPIEGRFTDEQRVVYEAVWEANQAQKNSLSDECSFRRTVLGSGYAYLATSARSVNFLFYFSASMLFSVFLNFLFIFCLFSVPFLFSFVNISVILSVNCWLIVC